MPWSSPVHRPHGKHKVVANAKRRKGSTARGYDARWQRARSVFLMQHPLCAACEAIGRVTAATDVDHVTPHRGDRRLFWDEANWQALCKPCHSRKTARGA